jgi:hypothetical protein
MRARRNSTTRRAATGRACGTARADFERRNARIECDAAQLERDRAEHETRFPPETANRAAERAAGS